MNEILLALVVHQLENLCKLLTESNGADSAEYFIAEQQKEIIEAVRRNMAEAKQR